MIRVSGSDGRKQHRRRRKRDLLHRISFRTSQHGINEAHAIEKRTGYQARPRYAVLKFMLDGNPSESAIALELRNQPVTSGGQDHQPGIPIESPGLTYTSGPAGRAGSFAARTRALDAYRDCMGRTLKIETALIRQLTGRFAKSALFAPFAFAAWYALHGLFAEKLPQPYPKTADGFTYIEITRFFMESTSLDYYRVMRIVPSGIVHYTLEWLGLPLTNANILSGFEIMNLVSIAVTIFVVDRTLRLLEVSKGTRELAFVLLVMSFSVLKYSVYYAVLTDMPALCLGTLLLFLHLKGHQFALAATTFIGAFTWPILLYQGLILLAFPVHRGGAMIHDPLPRWSRTALSCLSGAFGAGVLAYAVFYLRGNPSFGYLTIDVAYLLLSSVLFVMAFSLLPIMVFERAFMNPRKMLRRADWRWLVGGGGIFLAVSKLKDMLVTSSADPGYGSIQNLLKIQADTFTELPFITFVAHTSYFGCVIPLLLLFWGPFSREAAKHGPGVALALLLNLYAVGLNSQSRLLVNLLPWLVIFLVTSLDHYRLPRRFAQVILLLNVLLSKVWLHIADPAHSARYKMSLGPWMSRESWRLQIVLFFAIGGFLLFWLGRTKRGAEVSSSRWEPAARKDDRLDHSSARGERTGGQRAIPPWIWAALVVAIPFVHALTQAWVLAAARP